MVKNSFGSELPFASSALTFFLPRIHPTKMAINKPPTGRNMFAETQSIASKIFKPKIRNVERSPIDNEHKMPRIEIRIVAKMVEVFLLILNSSLK